MRKLQVCVCQYFKKKTQAFIQHHVVKTGTRILKLNWYYNVPGEKRQKKKKRQSVFLSTQQSSQNIYRKGQGGKSTQKKVVYS